MDIIQIIISKYILEVLGASIRWVYINFISLIIKRKEYVTFTNLWSPKISRGKKEENEMRNYMIGVIVFMFFIVLLVMAN